VTVVVVAAEADAAPGWFIWTPVRKREDGRKVASADFSSSSQVSRWKDFFSLTSSTN
jgi:hypothetical protein